jgi:hypothetical protein
VSTPPHDPPPGGESPGPHEPAAEEPRCPRCGAPHDPLQEYCLECGLRLVPLPRERFVRTTVWSRESPIWLWVALGALLLVALAAGGIVALAATDEDDAGAGASSQPAVALPPTSTITIETITGPTTSTLAPPTTSTMATTTTTGSTTTNPDEIISWPSGEDGYTVVLQSTPTSQGRGPAEAAAEDAIDAGLNEVGILNSSNYSSLNPGYYVTFTGVYDTQSQAENALSNARSKGFPTAYVRRVAD